MHSNVSGRDRLIKRLRYLWTGELFASFFLPAMALLIAHMLQRSMRLFAVYSIGLVTWILWQGAAYWWLKLQAVKTDSDIEDKHLHWFAVLKGINWVLIGVLPVLLVIKGRAGTVFSSKLDLTAGLAFYILAVLEQVNYYHYQLMYDYRSDWRFLVQERRLKRSSLDRALERFKVAEG